MKTYQQWSESGKSMTQFLQVGDEVDESIADYTIEVLPPATWTGSVIQMGEAFTYSPDGFQAFITLEKRSENWVYTGVKTTPKHGLVAVEISDSLGFQP